MKHQGTGGNRQKKVRTKNEEKIRTERQTKTILSNFRRYIYSKMSHSVLPYHYVYILVSRGYVWSAYAAAVVITTTIDDHSDNNYDDDHVELLSLPYTQLKFGRNKQELEGLGLKHYNL